MASQLLRGLGTWFPRWQDEAVTAINATTYVLDAAGEVAAFICHAPRTGNIQGVECYIGAVTNVLNNGLRCGIQGVDASTGLNDGSYVQSVTSAANTPAATGWFSSANFGSVIAVTRGDLIAIVFDNPSFTASDNIALGGYTISSSQAFPYGITATSTKQTSNFPIVAVRYDDGVYAPLNTEHWAINGISSRDFQNDTAIREVGLSFSLDFPAVLRGMAFRGLSASANNTHDVIVYDTDGTTPLLTKTIDGDVVSSVNSPRISPIIFPSDIVLAAGSRYRVVVKAGSATINTRVYYATFNALALMDTVDGCGQDWYATTKDSSGVWTDYNNGTDGYHMPMVSLLLNGFDDGGPTNAEIATAVWAYADRTLTS